MDNYKILAHLDIEKVVNHLHEEVYSEYGLLQDIKLAGDNIMITCPYHSGGTEKNVSMGVTLEDKGDTKKGTCHCFTCNTTTNLVDMISFVHGRNDNGKFGRNWLSKNYLVDTDIRTPINIIKQKVESTNYVSNTVVNRYAENIPTYVLNRGVSIDVASYFKVGYSKKEHHVIFPVYDHNGVCRFIQRRAIDFKYFSNDEGADKGSILYGFYQLTEVIKNSIDVLDLKELYVVESIIDALYLWSNGKSAVATLQAVPTKEQISFIKKLPHKIIIGAQDNDPAGIRGFDVLKKSIKGKLIKRFNFPHYAKDVNDIPPNELLKINHRIV